MKILKRFLVPLNSIQDFYLSACLFFEGCFSQEKLFCFLQNHLGNNLLVTVLTVAIRCDLANFMLLTSEGPEFHLTN